MERLGGRIFFGCCFFASATAATQKKKAPSVNQGALIGEASELWDVDSELCQTRDICRAAIVACVTIKNWRLGIGGVNGWRQAIFVYFVRLPNCQALYQASKSKLDQRPPSTTRHSA
jgi:hypothetical protein